MSNENYEAFATGGLENQVFGPDIASATSITITHRYHVITGTAEINTITPPWAGFNGELVLIPEDAFTLGTSGNILTAVTATADVPLVLHYDGADWRPMINPGNLVGNLTGDVTGDVTGNLTGDVTGNVTGDLTGSVDIGTGLIAGAERTTPASPAAGTAVLYFKQKSAGKTALYVLFDSGTELEIKAEV